MEILNKQLKIKIQRLGEWHRLEIQTDCHQHRGHSSRHLLDVVARGSKEGKGPRRESLGPNLERCWGEWEDPKLRLRRSGHRRAREAR